MPTSPDRARALALLGTVASLCLAGHARAESLSEALTAAYRRNPQLAAERARQRADDENVPRALAGYRPTISADLGFGPTFQRDEQGRLSRSSTVTPALTIVQPIYDGQRTTAAVRSAESGVFAGRETLRATEQSVLLAAATAYMNVIRDRAIVDLQRSNVAFLREVLRLSRKRLETGDVSPTDPAQAESRLQRGLADLALADAALVTSRAEYRAVIGHPPGRLAAPDPGEGPLVTLAASLRSGLEEHPDIRAAMHAADGALADVRVAASDLLPSISAQSGLNGAIGGPRDPDTPPFSASIGLQATVPIYDGGLASAQVRQAKETAGQRRFELEATREQVRVDVRSSWGTLEAARSATRAGEVAVAANETALQGVQREAREGQRTTLDVLNAQQELINARTNLIAAQRDRVVAGYASLAASGRLSQQSLRLSGPTYRPEQHFEQVRYLLRGTLTP